MSEKISKRKLESYKRAEMACQELRYQIANNADREDMQLITEYVLHWMRVTGKKVKFNRPERIKTTQEKIRESVERRNHD